VRYVGEGFVSLAEKYEALKDQLKQLRAELDAEAAKLGVGAYVQGNDGTVYKIIRPQGTYVEFREIGYERTAKAGESRGSLSKKEAQEAGFALPGVK